MRRRKLPQYIHKTDTLSDYWFSTASSFPESRISMKGGWYEMIFSCDTGRDRLWHIHRSKTFRDRIREDLDEIIFKKPSTTEELPVLLCLQSGTFL